MPLLSRVRALFRTRSPPFKYRSVMTVTQATAARALAWRLALGRAALGLCALGLCAPAPGRAAERAAALRHRGPAAGCRACRLCADHRHGRAGGQPRHRGQRAAAVQGWYAPQDALSRLLAGTGLQARYSSATAFTLVEPAAKPSGPDGDRPATVPLAYAGVLQRTVTRALCQWRGAEFGRYRAALQLWIGRNGVSAAPRRSRARATRGATRR